MTERRWLAVAAAAGAAFVGLSFVSAWIVHDRVLLGEGYRHVETMVGAWRGRGVPVLTLAALGSAAVAALAGRALLRVDAVATPLLVVSAAVLALTVATAVPVMQVGHASSVELRPGPLLVAGIGLAIVMVAAGAALARPPTRRLLRIGVGAVALVVLGAGVRWGELHLAEGSDQSWADGAYARPATGELPSMTLRIDGARYQLGDRWAGTWEGSGWTVTLDDDPACPTSRGTYHAHAEGDADLRFVMVVDSCEDGARAEALEAGIWERAP